MTVMCHDAEGVGELDLSALPGLRLFQNSKNIRRDDITAERCELARCFLYRRFLDHILNVNQIRIFCWDAVHDAIRGDRAFGDDLAADDGGTCLLVLVHKLLQCRGFIAVVHDIITKNDAEWFIINEILRAEYGVAEASHIWLTGVVDLDRSDLADFFQKIHFAGFIKMLFEFRGGVEVVFDSPLGVTGNDQDLLNAACFDLFDDILDGRFVDDRQHFLRHGFCFRQETGAKAGGRNDGFSDFLHDNSPSYEFYS